MKFKGNLAFVILGIIGLIGVRFLEETLFYDPFLTYFKTTDGSKVFPVFQWEKLVLGHLFRLILNLFFSLIIVYFLFKDKKKTMLACVLMSLVFLITFPIYLYLVYTEFNSGLLLAFYVRRFVIQPMILLLIIPMFYYMDIKNKDMV
ncbi:exosortase F system-associated protein [Riemerella anatipestifer]|nr:exosortase F system-associated protein [Riemerella anatipestifer]MDY3325168.1 exosortase F system-associated protein [Riemerella anatipestifer]MDY3352843.1 exosortase F system-associated protein [Riemerella anatipestifer]